MVAKNIQVWDLWYPKGGATGVPFARGRLDATAVLFVHAPPEYLTVEVRSDKERLLARGKDLKQTGDYPMAQLRRRGTRITRKDRFPTEVDIGSLVILPGGEVGTLRAWWNAEDGSEWRWQLELYNHR